VSHTVSNSGNQHVFNFTETVDDSRKSTIETNVYKVERDCSTPHWQDVKPHNSWS